MLLKFSRRFRAYLVAAVVIVVCAPGIVLWRTVRQERLDHALIAAIITYEPEKALLLLDSGADPNARDLTPDNRTLWQRLWELFRSHRPTSPTSFALHTALERFDISERDASLRLIRTMIERGADCNARGPMNRTPLMYVSFFPSEVIPLLVSKGADPNATDDQGMTALHLVQGDPKAITALLNAGADPNATDKDGYTPLMIATEEGSEKGCSILLRRGADINRVDRISGATALHHAAIGGQARIAALLIRSGADPTRRDSSGKTPLDWAYKSRRTVEASEQSQTITVLHDAVRKRLVGKLER